MKIRSLQKFLGNSWLLLTMAIWPALGNAQVAVADIEAVEELPIATAAELETLVGPIALYPDDLLAVVLPASTYPLQVIEAARFLEALENDPSLEPDEDWNDAVVALLNYPEVVALLNEDLDWMWRLGEAVAAQQADVIAAIELFRDRAYAAGNLKSDDYQLVTVEDSTIQITPVEEDVIYVPYYEPERVIVYQPRPVYYYYPRAYPVYYYPYPSYHAFHDRFFWGVTTAFSIGWHHHHLNVFHHSYYGHPYYGRSYYWNNWWYRRPSINVYNNVYVNNRVHVTNDRYRSGDRWYPSSRRTVRNSDQRVTRSRYYSNTGASDSTRTVRNTGAIGSVDRSSNTRNELRPKRTDEPASDISFRSRPTTVKSSQNSSVGKRPSDEIRPKRTDEPASDIRFRSRPTTAKSSQNSSVGKRPSTIKPTVKQSPSRQPTVKQTPSRQPTVKQAPSRQPTVRRSQPTIKQAPSRQPTVRQSQPTIKQAPSRQSTVRQSQPRQSQPRVSQSRPSQSATRSSAPSRSSAPQRSQSSSSKSSSSSSSKSSRSSSRMASKSRDR